MLDLARSWHTSPDLPIDRAAFVEGLGRRIGVACGHECGAVFLNGVREPEELVRAIELRHFRDAASKLHGLAQSFGGARQVVGFGSDPGGDFPSTGKTALNAREH